MVWEPLTTCADQRLATLHYGDVVLAGVSVADTTIWRGAEGDHKILRRSTDIAVECSPSDSSEDTVVRQISFLRCSQVVRVDDPRKWIDPRRVIITGCHLIRPTAQVGILQAKRVILHQRL